MADARLTIEMAERIAARASAAAQLPEMMQETVKAERTALRSSDSSCTR